MSAPRFEFYQSLTHMTVACLARDADASRSTASVAADGHSLSVSLGLASGADFSLELSLFECAVPGAATLSVRAPRTEVRFEKAPSARFMWPTLERAAGTSIAQSHLIAQTHLISQSVAAANSVVAAESAAAAAAATVGGGAAVNDAVGASGSASAGGVTPEEGGGGAPTKPKAKDWNKLEKELAAEEEAAGEGEEALMKLFRGIYTGADENTRRAMVKSFQTSGGTVLSTNWGEVAKEDYEKTMRPPEGMEFVKDK